MNQGVDATQEITNRKVLRDRMPRSPGLFHPVGQGLSSLTISQQLVLSKSHHKALFLYTSHTYCIEPEHLSPDLVWAHGYAHTIPNTKFYPLCASSICLGRVNSEEISLCMRTGLCIHKHLIRYSQTHDVCEHNCYCILSKS